MTSLSPFALSGDLDLSSPQPSSADTIHVTSSYTVNNGDTLDLAGSPGFKLEVRNHTSVTLDINGTVTLDGGDRGFVVGVLTSVSRHGDATVTIGATGSLSVTSDVFGATVAGALMGVDGSDFFNNGALHVTASKGVGGGAVAEGAIGALLANNGVMTVEAREAYGFYMDDGKGLAINNLTMDVTGKQAAGLYAIGGADATNNGSIRVTGADTAVGIVEQGGDVVNNGLIHAVGKGEVAGIEAIELTSFLNNGHILAEAPAGGLSVGLLFTTASGGGLMTNNGVIRGDDFAAVAVDVIGPIAASNDVLINNGRLDGAVSMGGGSDGISNVGRIDGDIDLGDGGDILISNRGHLGGVVMGGLGNDNIEASRGADTLFGDEQDDSAGGGDDILRGMKGDDTLFGGQGVDTLIGGKGVDLLWGGDGDDVFKFTKVSDSTPGVADTIADLTSTDVIDLHLIDADTINGGDQAFHIVGAFTGAAGELTITFDGVSDVTRINGDVDGDGGSDFQIVMGGNHSGFTNFVL